MIRILAIQSLRPNYSTIPAYYEVAVGQSEDDAAPVTTLYGGSDYEQARLVVRTTVRIMNFLSIKMEFDFRGGFTQSSSEHKLNAVGGDERCPN